MPEEEEVLGDIDDRGASSLGRLGGGVAEQVPGGQADVVVGHGAGCRAAGSKGSSVSATENRVLCRLRGPRGPNHTLGAARLPWSVG